MTPPSATLTPPSEPVLLTIGRRPADGPTGVLPVPLTTASIKDDEFQIIADLDEAAEGAECSCSAGDDQPY
ncbi:hypothetical protein LK07_17970 [Streptomyces pluripotens]|uniref:Uncharacterized protein n=1 Tax=Streptomyces pluripotens TaxID=1355015 RepID=A0A221P060_9ACTN|nr:hypothetical protein [Streptomyces pluripotens]ARP71348.1 hypothetical protein LK06_016815 [Streptomyces pluripotens]ASN25600.1 hypothetical protein LK07_17970 [Streptomyces pluripotens]